MGPQRAQQGRLSARGDVQRVWGTQWYHPALRVLPAARMNALNEYGVPLHACNGYRLDEHYWRWLEYRRTGQ